MEKVGIKRTKTGCLTCRSRRIKCDEQKPRCYECQIYDFKCVGLFYQGLTTATETPIRSCVTDNISPRVGATSDVRDVLYLAPSLGRNNNGSEAIIGKLPLYMGSMAKLRNSYMAFLPAMAGYEIALDKAVQCVAAALREIYCKREYPSSSLQARWQSVNLYIEALKHLQVAINDRRRSVSSEILCATLLLCFYEGLCSTGASQEGSIQHAQGASKLIQHRGADQFTTELDKTLLASHFIIIIADSWLSSSRIFLDDTDWRDALESCISCSGSYFECSELEIASKINHLAPLTLLVDTTNFLVNSQQPICGSEYEFEFEFEFEFEEKRLELLQRFNTIRQSYKKWLTQTLKDMNDTKAKEASETSSLEPGYATSENYLEVICLGDVGYMMQNRVYVALGGKDGLELELEAERIALRLLSIYEKDNRSARWHSAAIAILPSCHAILSTADEWKVFISSAETGVGVRVMGKEMFTCWLRVTGIKI